MLEQAKQDFLLSIGNRKVVVLHLSDPFPVSNSGNNLARAIFHLGLEQFPIVFLFLKFTGKIMKMSECNCKSANLT